LGLGASGASHRAISARTVAGILNNHVERVAQRGEFFPVHDISMEASATIAERD
jgi:hypothetical protein